MKTVQQFIKENDYSGPATVKVKDRISNAINNWNTEVVDNFDATFGVVSWSDFDNLRVFCFKLMSAKKTMNFEHPRTKLPEIKPITTNPYNVLLDTFTVNELNGMSIGEIGNLIRLAKKLV